MALRDIGCDLGDFSSCNAVELTRHTRLIEACKPNLPQGREACLRALPPCLAIIDRNPELTNEQRAKERLHLMHISCAGVPRSECNGLPSEEEERISPSDFGPNDPH